MREARRRAALSAILIFAAGAAARAQAPEVRARIVTPPSLAAASSNLIAVELLLPTGLHVQSRTPSERYLIPTVLTLSGSAGTLSAIRYPNDAERRFPFAEKPLRVYEGAVRFEADLDLPAGANGEVALRGTLTYQACDDRQCFPPGRIPLEAKIPVSAAGPAPPALRPAGADAPALPEPRRVAAAEPAAPPLDLRTLTDARFSLDALKGSVVILDFWAPWCLPCRESFPFLDRLQAKYASQGLRVVGLTLEESSDSVYQFLDEVPVRFTLLRDPSGQAGEAFRVAAMPTTFLIDRDGRVAARFEGGGLREQGRLEEAAALLLSGKPVPPGTGTRASAGLRETGGIKAWRRGYLADPMMNLDGDPLARILRDHIHASKEASAGDGGASGGGCGCN